MSWNYRVVRGEYGLRIYDVYYDGDGNPIATHQNPTYVYGDQLQDLKQQLMLMIEALEKPVLDVASIGERRRMAPRVRRMTCRESGRR